MIRFPVLGILAVFAAIQSSSMLQAAPLATTSGVVIQNRAEVRSGPSDAASFYVTNLLAQGERIEITAEKDGGWLEILPPRGSVSFINELVLVQINPTTYFVTGQARVPVFIGSQVHNQKPTVIGAQVSPGTQVLARGNPFVDPENKRWMPIEPPAQERRYIRASAVQRQDNSATTLAGKHSGRVQSGFAPTPRLDYSTAPSANTTLTAEQLYQKAQEAERSGQLAQAIPLYHQVAAQAYATNQGLYLEAQRRARFLEGDSQPNMASPSRLPMTVPAAVGVTGFGNSTSPPITRLPGPATTTNVVPPVPGQDTSGFLPAQGPTGSPPRGPGQSMWMRYRGYLRLPGRVSDNQRVYALWDPTTLQPILYATPGAGVNLEPYLHEHANRIIWLGGYTVWRSDWRNNYMVVTQVLVE